MDSYLIHILITIGIYAILAISLQFAIGYGGILSLGHMAFYGIGAYLTAYLTVRGYPFYYAFFAGLAGSGVVGYLLARITNQLKGDYLALATIALNYVFIVIVANWDNVTGGYLGINSIPRPTFGNYITSNTQILIIVWFFVLFTYLFLGYLAHSRFGNVVQAVRDDELGSQVIGKNSFRVKRHVLVLSALFAGVAGVLYASYTSYIHPNDFSFTTFLPLLTLVLLGGLASLSGTLLASSFVVLLPELLRLVGLPLAWVGPGQQIIYSIILLAIIIYRPQGFYGKTNLQQM